MLLRLVDLRVNYLYYIFDMLLRHVDLRVNLYIFLGLVQHSYSIDYLIIFQSHLREHTYARGGVSKKYVSSLIRMMIAPSHTEGRVTMCVLGVIKSILNLYVTIATNHRPQKIKQ